MTEREIGCRKWRPSGTAGKFSMLTNSEASGFNVTCVEPILITGDCPFRGHRYSTVSVNACCAAFPPLVGFLKVQTTFVQVSVDGRVPCTKPRFRTIWQL